MYIDIIWKIALPILIGLFVTASLVMNSGAESRSAVVHGTAGGPLECDIRDPFSPLPDISYRAEGFCVLGSSF
jgi:hypothetical protein